MLTTDSKEALYEASYEAQMTRKIRLYLRPHIDQFQKYRLFVKAFLMKLKRSQQEEISSKDSVVKRLHRTVWYSKN